MTAKQNPPRRVLVIEDGTTTRLYYRDILEGIGFEVEEAANGLEGVERALADTFDLLVVDINMPKMDGYEVIRTVRGDRTLWRLPVITISTEDRPEDSRRAYEAGSNFYLAKPVDPDVLAQAAHLLTAEAAP